MENAYCEETALDILLELRMEANISSMRGVNVEKGAHRYTQDLELLC